MEITATLDYGPLNVELSSENREEVQENLLSVVEFLDENKGAFEQPGLKIQDMNKNMDGEGQVQIDSSQSRGNDESTPADSPLADLARELNVSIDQLDEIVYVDPEKQERPHLMIDGEKLGSSVPEKQRNAAFILLTALEQCYGKDRMKTSEFKNLLTVADISDSTLSRAWDESQIDSSGRGTSATISLKGPGRREAKSLLKNLAEDV